MSGISKRVSGSWVSGDYGIMGTSTDTITTLPAVLYADGNNATVGLVGNMVQNGTPTPDSPVMPQGTGERTGNLWDEDYTGISGYLKYVPVFVGEGTFTLSTDTPDYSRNAPLFLLSGNVTSGASSPVNGVYNGLSRTTDSSNGYITIAFRQQSESSNPMTHKTMLNLGSTALPYEPYGIEIPISSAGQTTPIYLGEVETTRQIRKYEFTGTENFDNDYGQSLFGVQKLLNSAPFVVGISAYSTHFIYNSVQSGLDAAMSNGEFALQQVLSMPRSYNVFFKNTAFTTKADFKAWLAAQYANGTPVCVWYVLANAETAVVNEPLMKIGEYADEVSGITIPTTAGANTLTVDTTLQPSEVTVNYKGWHPVANVHEAENGAWT